MSNASSTSEGAEVAFKPAAHLLHLKSRDGSKKDYLPVQWRLVWFREQCPQGTIDTEELEYDLDRECSVEVYEWDAEKRRSVKVVKTAKGYARYRAVVTDGRGGRATGTKSENAATFPDFGEKAETGAVGRALAGLGFGTQFAPELDEGDRLADAPVPLVATTPAPAHQGQDAPTPQQLDSIVKVARVLGRSVAPPATYGQAAELITQLNTDLRLAGRQRPAS